MCCHVCRCLARTASRNRSLPMPGSPRGIQCNRLRPPLDVTGPATRSGRWGTFCKTTHLLAATRPGTCPAGSPSRHWTWQDLFGSPDMAGRQLHGGLVHPGSANWGNPRNRLASPPKLLQGTRQVRMLFEVYRGRCRMCLCRCLGRSRCTCRPLSANNRHGIARVHSPHTESMCYPLQWCSLRCSWLLCRPRCH